MVVPLEVEEEIHGYNLIEALPHGNRHEIGRDKSKVEDIHAGEGRPIDSIRWTRKSSRHRQGWFGRGDGIQCA